MDAEPMLDLTGRDGALLEGLPGGGFDVDCIAYCRFDTCCDEVRMTPCFGADPEEDGSGVPTSLTVPLDESPCNLIRRSGQVLPVGDWRTEAGIEPSNFMRAEAFVALLGAPVFGPGGAPIGALTLLSRTPRSWTAEEEARLAGLARRVSRVLAGRLTLRSPGFDTSTGAA